MKRERLRVALVVLAGCAAAPPPASPHPPSAAVPSLAFTYLGVAGWTIDDGAHVVVVDPYFSRPADRDHPVPDPAAIAAHAPPRANLIVVGHAHYDHALDAPEIARRTGAMLLAAPPVLAAARDAGVPNEHLLIAQVGDDYELPGLSVRVIASLHSVIGFADGGDVPTFAYLVRLGGAQVLVFDTANFDEAALAGVHPDVAIIAPGYRERIHDYTCRLMNVLGRPAVVLPTHFDDHRAPVGTPLTEHGRADLDAFAREVHACSPNTRVIVPTAFAPLRAP